MYVRIRASRCHARAFACDRIRALRCRERLGNVDKVLMNEVFKKCIGALHALFAEGCGAFGKR